jgi:hypothetical protein
MLKVMELPNHPLSNKLNLGQNHRNPQLYGVWQTT